MLRITKISKYQVFLRQKDKKKWLANFSSAYNDLINSLLLDFLSTNKPCGGGVFLPPRLEPQASYTRILTPA